ncbi:MAG: hypothetical protein MR413_06350 [Clostridia bacterium]|nr:hypothetical protein [Clostridia bacterium]
MVKTVNNYANVEKLIYLVAENQKFAKPKDKLTALIEKFSDYMSEELDEDDLVFAAAAKMPDVPKYKTIKDM